MGDITSPPCADARSIVPVLVYHEVSNGPDRPFQPYTATPAMLRSHIQVLRRLGYDLVTVSDLAEHLRAGSERKVAAITFDDALRSFATHALPVLADEHVPTTMYVPTAWVGATARWMGSSTPLMTWRELRSLHPAVVELGSHGHHHLQLDIAPACEAEHDIATSKARMEDELDRAITSFAYPHGSYRRRVRDMVVDAGFTSACAVKNAWSLATSDRFAIARVTVGPDMSGDRLHDRLVAGRPIDPRRERPRTTVYRELRRARAAISRLGDVR